MNIRIIIIYLIILTFLTSCANSQDSKRIGQVFGAISGTIIGSKLGKGTGKNISIASGTILGSIIGEHLAKKISESDMDFISKKTKEVLTDEEIGKKYSWKNLESGNSGYVKSMKNFKNRNKNCKEIKQVINFNSNKNEIYSSACKQADGSWKITKLNK